MKSNSCFLCDFESIYAYLKYEMYRSKSPNDARNRSHFDSCCDPDQPIKVDVTEVMEARDKIKDSIVLTPCTVCKSTFIYREYL